MKIRVFLRPNSYFLKRNAYTWSVDIYDGNSRYRGGYCGLSKKEATKMKRHIIRTNSLPTMAIDGSLV